MFNEIQAKGSAVVGFGTKVDNLKPANQAMKNKKAPALDSETDDDVLLESYSLYHDQAAVEKRYEDALAAFDDEQQAEEINVSIIGRPNLGKSSLLNAILVRIGRWLVMSLVQHAILLKLSWSTQCHRVRM